MIDVVRAPISWPYLWLDDMRSDIGLTHVKCQSPGRPQTWFLSSLVVTLSSSGVLIRSKHVSAFSSDLLAIRFGSVLDRHLTGNGRMLWAGYDWSCNVHGTNYRVLCPGLIRQAVNWSYTQAIA